jgi:hypothetical protein
MKYLEIYHLSKWNPQNQLIIQQTCVQVTKLLTIMILHMWWWGGGANPKVGPEGFLILNNMRDRKMPRITRQLFSQVKEFHRSHCPR